ncbi:hypothetical protein [Novosphingobium panipatense]|uniref:Acyl-protein synthetase LuxE n=2 Tax=Novosphingobium panipatense TaxID=428991 RepID=A0ABY1QLK3_9SPHN|nr:hypothetical protein [Novosphingobium panipatense]SMP74418.1 hypothetical protein SAMN06296065_10762 [Novosphingobium panipatense]
MGAAADKLMALVADPERFTFSAHELRETQVAALDERFQERRAQIKLLGLRARDAGVERIARIEDVVPVLFPHTAYKSYPESYLMDERWDRLTKWLGTVSAHPVAGVSLDGVQHIDDWIARLADQGHFISCSSGTTGKSAMLIASRKDMEWSKVDTVNVFSWGSGVIPAQDRLIVGCAPVATVPKNATIAQAQYEAFANPEWPRWNYPVPPITVGSLTAMVVMRKKIADGTARPDEIAAFEQTSAERARLVADAVPATARFIIENRHRKLQLSGLWSGLWQVAKAVRDAGYGREDFDPDNSIYVGGGLKRAQLPVDYQEYVFDTFNIPADRHFQNYSMQELNSGMPKCRQGGRYHVPPWVIPILLDKSGDNPLTHGRGEQEGRAAFFDLSLDGRWGGVITGDKVSLDYSPCACGNQGPSIRDTIVRYADLEGDDKIGCAGTVDAYVRGVA